MVACGLFTDAKYLPSESDELHENLWSAPLNPLCRTDRGGSAAVILCSLEALVSPADGA